MIILGINAYHADASAAIVMDEKLVAAAEEERFTRVKHNAGFPSFAVRYCLQEAGIKPEEVTHIAVSRNPKAHAAQKILYSLKRGKWDVLLDRISSSRKIWNIREAAAEALAVPPERLKAKVHWVEHHRAHLASSFFVSSFEKAALLSVDGFGDFVSTMWGIGEGNHLKIQGLVPYPHSLGVFYTAITQFLGFPTYGDEYKVMGLAAYGEPAYQNEFSRMIRKNGGVSFRLSLPYFRHTREGVSMTWEKGSPTLGDLYSGNLEQLLGEKRGRDESVEKRHKDIASSLQKQLEEILFFLLNELYAKTKCEKLCMAGGVALNCVANGKIFERTPFREVYIQPAAGDAGTSVGAAFYVAHEVLNRPRSFVMQHANYGPAYSNAEMKSRLDSKRVSYEEISSPKLHERVAERISNGDVVGVFQGRMEFGPRALGNRSILADPRRSEMKETLNERIKYREPFRPFAPAVLETHLADYFQGEHPSPFMLFAYPATPEKRSVIPACVHVDGTGRVQTVSQESSPFLWETIKAFHQLTGVPVLLNTSFNENEPIVCTPEEALDCFLRTRMDTLALGNFLVKKEQSKKELGTVPNGIP